MEFSLKSQPMDGDGVASELIVAEKLSSEIATNDIGTVECIAVPSVMGAEKSSSVIDGETTDSSSQVNNKLKVNNDRQEKVFKNLVSSTSEPNRKIELSMGKAKSTAPPIKSKLNAFQETTEICKNSMLKNEYKSQTKKICFRFRFRDFHTTEISKGEILYKCHICRGMYKQKFSLKRHFLRNHIWSEYISTADLSNCKINTPNGEEDKLLVQVEAKMLSGRKRFKTDNEVFLESNKGRHMPGLYRCHHCPGIRFDLEAELKDHYDWHFNLNCDLQNKSTTYKHKVRDIFHCKRCSVSFDVEEDYIRHLHTHPNVKRCKYCEKEFSTTANRKRHEKIHMRGRGFSCDQCKAKFPRSKELEKHVKKMHDSLSIICQHCPKHLVPKIFSSLYFLEMHVREKHKDIVVDILDVTKSGRGRKPSDAVCCYCKKRFPSVKTMVQHKNVMHKKEMGLHKSKLNQQDSNDFRNVKILEGGVHENEKVSDKNSEQLDKKRTTYVRKAKQATQKKPLKDKSKKKEAEEKERLERIENNRFYAVLAENIAENLSKHIDGKVNQVRLANYDFRDSGEHLDLMHNRDTVSWSGYNFPNNYDLESDLSRREKFLQRTPCTDYSNVIQATGLEKKEMDGLNLNRDENQVVKSPNCPASLAVDEVHEHFISDCNGTTYVCKVCMQTFHTESNFKDHFINNHPNIEMSCIEFEGIEYSSSEIPLELRRPYFSDLDGILISSAAPPSLPPEQEMNCSKCNVTCKGLQELYSHILECGDSKDNRPYKKKRYSAKRLKHIVKHRTDEKQNSGIRNIFKYGYVKRDYKCGKDYFNIQTGKRGRRSQLSFYHKSGTCRYCNSKFASEVRLNDHFETCPNRFKKRKPVRKCKKVKMQENGKSPNFSPSSPNSSSENGANNGIVLSSRFHDSFTSTSSTFSNQVLSTNIIVTTAEVHSENVPLNQKKVITTSSLVSIPQSSVINESVKNIIPIEQLDKTPIDALKDLVRDTAPCITDLLAKGKGISETYPRGNVPKIKEVVKEMQLIRKAPANSNLKNSALVFSASENEVSATEKTSVSNNEPCKASKAEINRKRKSTPIKIVLKKPAETQNSIENNSFTLEKSSKQAVVADICTSSGEEFNKRATVNSATDLAKNDTGICIKQDKLSTTLFLPEEKTKNINNSEDRDSPTLELLVSSVTQNIENFDKPSLLDDEKFALPPPNLKSTVLTSNDSNEVDSTANSLNFKVIMPNVDSTSNADKGMSASSLNPVEKPIMVHLLTVPGNPVAENIPHLDIISDVNDKLKSTSEEGINMTKKIDSMESVSVDDKLNDNLLLSNKIRSQIPNILPVNRQFLKAPSSEGIDETSNASNSIPTLDVSPLVQQNSFETKEENIFVDGYNTAGKLSKEKQLLKKLPLVTSSTIDTSITSPQNLVNIDCDQTYANSSSRKMEKNSEPLNSVGADESQDLHSNNLVVIIRDNGAAKRGKRKSKLPVNKLIKEGVSCPKKICIETEHQIVESLDHKTNDNIRRQQESDSLDKNAKLRSFRMKKSECFKTSVEILSDGKAQCSNTEDNDINKPGSSSIDNSIEEKEIVIKKEFKEPEVRNRRCPFCYLEFAYLSNFRRHIRQCPSKSENVTDENVVMQTASSSSQLQHLPNKDEVAQSMLNLLRHQLRQSQMIKESSNVNGRESSDLNFKRFSCDICHKIFFSLITFMKHNMRHSVEPGMMAASPDECGEGSSVRVSQSGQSLESNFIEDSETAEQELIIAKEEETFRDDNAPSSGVENIGKKDIKTLGDVECSSNNDNLLILTSTTAVTKSISSTPNSRNVSSNKYKVPLDVSSLVLPSYGKGRGRKKKCVSENGESACESSFKKLDDETGSVVTSDATNDLETCVKENLVTKLRKNLTKRILSGGVNPKISPVKLGKKVVNLKEEDGESNSEQKNGAIPIPSTFPIETEVRKKFDVSEKNDSDQDINKITTQDISSQSIIVSKRGKKRSATVPKQLNSLKGRKRKSKGDSQNAMDELTTKVKIEEDNSKIARFKLPSNQSDCLVIPGVKKVPVGKDLWESTSTSKPPKSTKNSITLISVESSPKVNSYNCKTKGAKSSPSVVCDNKPNVSSSGKNKSKLLSHCAFDPEDLSDFKNVKPNKKKMNKICPICKKKFPAALHLQRHMQLVHSRRNPRIESPISPKEEEKLKKTVESPKSGRPSFQRQCSKPLPPMKRPYKKNVDKRKKLTL